MMMFDLPSTIEVAGREMDIRTDFRDILRILQAIEDSELSNKEKAYVCLYILYVDYDEIAPENMQEAYEKAKEFIDGGPAELSKKQGPATISWTQDARLLFPAVNKVAGIETRSAEYIHWWTFLGFFMEIKDSAYATVLSLRSKKAKGKKLEKWEQEFWRTNRDICVIRPKLTKEEQEEKDRLNALMR